MSPLRKFFEQDYAGATVELVALMPVFLFMTFFILEISVAVFSVGAVEKAAQVGVRFALVSDPAVNTNIDCMSGPTLRLINCPRLSTYPPGAPCSSNACENFVTVSCPGGGSNGQCSTALCTGAMQPCFNVILNRMRTISPLIQASNVTITYAYAGPAGSGLGYVGGPTVPRVTVTVANVPYGAVMTNLLTRIYSMVRRTPSVLTNLPTISATMTGEDLTTAGAS